MNGVLRECFPDTKEAGAMLKLVRNVLTDWMGIEDATRGSVVAADTLKDNVEAVLVEMAKTAKEPRSVLSVGGYAPGGTLVVGPRTLAVGPRTELVRPRARWFSVDKWAV